MQPKETPSRRFRLSEDWQATLIGLLLVLLIALGVITSIPYPLLGILGS